MNKTYSYPPVARLRRWAQILAVPAVLGLALIAAVSPAQAQEGSQGNTTVFSGAQMTFFGAHTFATGTGTQPGIIKTIRTAPFGIVSYGPAATQTGAVDAAHVDGYAGKSGTAAFTFPVGNGVKIRTAAISAPTSGDFKAAYWSVDPNAATLPAGAPFVAANLGTGVTAVSNVEYWDIDGPSAINLTLTWDAASALAALTGGNIANLAILGYSVATSKWENLGSAGGTTGTLAASGTIIANGVIPDNYKAFTFGVASSATPDLRPFTIITNTSYTETDISRPFTARIRNMNTGTTASSLITVRIYKPTALSVITLTGASASEWTIVSSGTFYTLTTNSDIPATGIGNSITATVTIPASIPMGVYPLRVFIPDLSGGEVIADNINNNLIVQLYKN